MSYFYKDDSIQGRAGRYVIQAQFEIWNESSERDKRIDSLSHSGKYRSGWKAKEHLDTLISHRMASKEKMGYKIRLIDTGITLIDF